MSNNGSNSWNVGYSHITWFEKLLHNHANIKSVSRRDDIVFEVERKRQKDRLTILCCNEYVFGITLVHRAITEFGKIDLIYNGGGWNGWTNAAKEYCLDQHIGLYITDEMSGALWADDFWSYYQKDSKGNRIDRIREE